MDKLRFGTAGMPWSAKGEGTVNGIKQVRKLNLDAMELEFVQNVYLKEKGCPEIKKASKDNDVVLTCHASYYINLNSPDKAKLDASINRILSSARITNLCGGYSVCFHAAFYHKDSKEQVYNKVKAYLKHIVKTLRNEGINIWIRPETGGKIMQFADTYDLIKLSSEIDGVLPCIDFAHQYSRTLGKWNNYEDYSKLFVEIEKILGKEGLNNMHCHTEGIEFTDAGEKNHVNLKDCKVNYKDLVKSWKDFKIKGIIICESPNIEDDALLLKKTYDKF